MLYFIEYWFLDFENGYHSWMPSCKCGRRLLILWQKHIRHKRVTERSKKVKICVTSLMNDPQKHTRLFWISVISVWSCSTVNFFVSRSIFDKFLFLFLFLFLCLSMSSPLISDEKWWKQSTFYRFGKFVQNRPRYCGKGLVTISNGNKFGCKIDTLLRHQFFPQSNIKFVSWT